MLHAAYYPCRLSTSRQAFRPAFKIPPLIRKTDPQKDTDMLRLTELKLPLDHADDALPALILKTSSFLCQVPLLLLYINILADKFVF